MKRSRRPPTVLLAAESLRPKASGIGRVARLMAKVLAEEERRGRVRVRSLALNDMEPASDLGIAACACRGSRVRFILECGRAAFDCTQFIYDAVSMARAHPRWFYPHRPSLVWMHGIEVWETPRAAHLRTLIRADCLISNSSLTRERAQRGEPDFARALLCWLATETDERAPPTPRNETERNVLLLGRIDPSSRKGHSELIDAWPRVLSEIPAARLIIAGGGSGEAMLRDQVARSPARHNIDVLGFVPEAELEALWARAQVFAMPSRDEGFGVAYIEAMRHGLPVLGSVHDAAAEVNVHGVTGVNVDLQQPNALSDAIVELLSQPVLRRSMGEAGRERWREHFCYSAFRARFLPILEGYLDID